MSRPLVSVIVPTWNRAADVARAIDSILAQTYRPIETIVVDDGSTDNTAEVLASYDGGIRVIRQRNRGVSSARNTGLAAMSGDYVGFLDSDDVWAPVKIERQVALMEAAGPEVVCCLTNSIEVEADGSFIRSFETSGFRPPLSEGILFNPVEILLTRFMLFTTNCLVRRPAMDAAGKFDESLMVLEDYAMALTLGTMGPWTYVMAPHSTVRRGTPHSLTTMADRNKGVEVECLLAALRKAQARSERLTAQEQRLLSEAMARARRQLRRMRRGRVKGPLGFVGRASLALWRRSPWFPRPDVRAVPGFGGAQPDGRGERGQAAWRC